MAERWKPFNVPMANLDYLPMTRRILEKEVVVDYMYTDELEAVYGLAQQAALHGDNVGEDEYPDLDTFQEVIGLANAEVFTVKEAGRLVGAFVARALRINRGWMPCTCHVFIFTTHELFVGGYHRHIMRIAEKLVLDLKGGYFVTTAWAFSSNTELIMDLRADGYQLCLCLPYCGKSAKHGAQQTWLLNKEIGPYQDIGSMEVLLSMAAEYFQESEPAPNTPLDVFPLQYTFKSKVRATLRELRPGDYEAYHSMYREAADSGAGYGWDEAPTFQIFKDTMIGGQHVMVMEETETGVLIGVSACMDWPHRRSQATEPRIGDWSLIMSPEWRGRGLGKEMSTLSLGFFRLLGYEHVISDIVVTNKRMRQIDHRLGTVAFGILPRGCYLRGTGWVDSVLSILDLTPVKTLTELVSENHHDTASAM